MATNNKNKNNTDLEDSRFMANLDSTLSNSGLPKNKLNEMLKSIEQHIRCDSECQRQKDIQALKQKWLSSKEKYSELPERIDEYEEKYFTLDRGQQYFRDNILRKRFDEHIIKWEADQQAKFNDVKMLMSTLLNNYTAETIAKSRINQLQDDVLEKNKALRRDLDQYYKQTLTDGRKVYYENAEIDNIKGYRPIIKAVYYALLVLYILFGSFFSKDDYKHWKVWVAIGAYIGFPFILRYLIDFTVDIYEEYF